MPSFGEAFKIEVMVTVELSGGGERKHLLGVSLCGRLFYVAVCNS